MIQKIRRVLVLFCCVFFLSTVIVGYQIFRAIAYKNHEEVLVRLPQGSGVKQIAQILYDNHLIRNKWIFVGYVQLTGQSHLMQAGEYLFKQERTFTEIVDQIRQGKVQLHKLTVPEGYTIYDVCALLQTKGFFDQPVTEKRLFAASSCGSLMRRVEWLKESDGIFSLEGYLFPETYLYDSSVTAGGLIQRMVGMFYDKMGTERIQQAKDKGLSVHELVTLASVIEKETGLASERPLVSAVIHNRLKRKMPLQMDPTVIYGLPRFDGNLRKEDLLTITPYNTYLVTGLPAGPICNPSMASIDAVLNPSPSEFLYFVAKGDGSHYFSKDLDEHSRAVDQYQRIQKMDH